VLEYLLQVPSKSGVHIDKEWKSERSRRSSLERKEEHADRPKRKTIVLLIPTLFENT